MKPDLKPEQILSIIKDRENGLIYKAIAKKYNISMYYVKKTIKIFENMDNQQIEDEIKRQDAILHVKWNGERLYANEYQMYKERYTLKGKKRYEDIKAARIAAKEVDAIVMPEQKK